jgi:hypothetical protein
MHNTMATWYQGFVKPCHMKQQFWQESLMDSTDRRYNETKSAYSILIRKFEEPGQLWKPWK